MAENQVKAPSVGELINNAPSTPEAPQSSSTSTDTSQAHQGGNQVSPKRPDETEEEYLARLEREAQAGSDASPTPTPQNRPQGDGQNHRQHQHPSQEHSDGGGGGGGGGGHKHPGLNQALGSTVVAGIQGFQKVYRGAEKATLAAAPHAAKGARWGAKTLSERTSSYKTKKTGEALSATLSAAQALENHVNAHEANYRDYSNEYQSILSQEKMQERYPDLGERKKAAAAILENRHLEVGDPSFERKYRESIETSKNLIKDLAEKTDAYRKKKPDTVQMTPAMEEMNAELDEKLNGPDNVLDKAENSANPKGDPDKSLKETIDKLFKDLIEAINKVFEKLRQGVGFGPKT